MGDTGCSYKNKGKLVTFLKADFACKDPATGNWFRNLQDVYMLKMDNWINTSFYATFTEMKEENISAVCMYNILDIKQAFNGDYKLANEPTPNPRPGSCITSAIRAQGYNSTKDLPSNVVNFVIKYPAMKEPVVSEAIIVKRDIKYTKIAVSHVHAAQDVFSIMLLTTDQGEVHKVVHRILKESKKTETELISDTVHFKNDEPFHQLKVSENLAFLGSPSAVIVIPVTNCSQNFTCPRCILSKWNSSCEDNTLLPEKQINNTTLLPTEDIVQGDEPSRPPQEEDLSSAPQQIIKATLGTNLALSCIPNSRYSSCRWQYINHLSSLEQNMDVIEVTFSKKTLGEYMCHCMNNQMRVKIVSYKLEMDECSGIVLEKTDRKLTWVIAILSLFLGIFIGSVCMYVFCKIKSFGPQKPNVQAIFFRSLK